MLDMRMLMKVFACIIFGWSKCKWLHVSKRIVQTTRIKLFLSFFLSFLVIERKQQYARLHMIKVVVCALHGYQVGVKNT